VTKNVNVNGQVSHLHTPVPIEALNLDFEAKKQLLRALREHKQEQNPETPDE
jgi:alpha-D-ribose 1-methylphosphonate 5-triphosphate synthase subunit PhnI